MPTINQQNSIEISPERFLAACSDSELYELHILMGGHNIQKRLQRIEDAAEIRKQALKKHRQQLEEGRFP